MAILGRPTSSTHSLPGGRRGAEGSGLPIRVSGRAGGGLPLLAGLVDGRHDAGVEKPHQGRGVPDRRAAA